MPSLVADISERLDRVVGHNNDNNNKEIHCWRNWVLYKAPNTRRGFDHDITIPAWETRTSQGTQVFILEVHKLWKNIT